MAVGIWDGDAEAGLAIDAALLRAVLAFCLHSEEMGGRQSFLANWDRVLVKKKKFGGRKMKWRQKNFGG